MANQKYQLNSTITPTKSSTTIRTFLPPELYLPEWSRNTEFFRCMTILLDYIQNSLKDFSNPKYAMIEQAYKDINFKYKDILQTSEECLRAMLTENGFGQILEIFNLSLEQLQMLTLYLPLLKIMKGTDEGYRLFLSLFASDFEIETWLDNPQELEEYTFNILFISWINVGLSSNFVDDFIKFSRSYVYPILKNVEMRLAYKYLSPFIYSYPRLKMDIMANFNGEASITWAVAAFNTNLNNHNWSAITYGNNTFVAIGNSGYTSTSDDGIIWTAAAFNTNLNNHSWSAVTYGNNTFVAIGINGYISTSDDGITWTAAAYKTSLGNRIWRGICYGNNIFVAIGTNGYISISGNGITWNNSIYNDALRLKNTWYDICYNGRNFVAMSSDGYISISNDGITWTSPVHNLKLGSHNWRRLCYDGAKFIAISYNGYTSASTDGRVWASSTRSTKLGSNYWSGLCYGTNFIALGEQGFISKYEEKIE